MPAAGSNAMGPIKQDELLFAEGSTVHVGQVIAVVVARSSEEARLASGLSVIMLIVLDGDG